MEGHCMKRAIIIIAIVGMFGWAVYDLVVTDEETTEEDSTQTEKSQEDVEVDQGEEETEVADDAEVGLEKGDVAPDFELSTLEGETMRLSDFRGEPVMLNFWATWCPPCRAEIPDMQKFYEDKDVTILAVNLYGSEQDKDDVPEFIEEFGMTFPVLLDEESKVSTKYNIQPIPTTYLINSDGRIHNLAFGPLNYDLMVQEFEKME